jgi:hypothetical protein
MEVTRAWQVMSAIYNYIATHKDSDGHLDTLDGLLGGTQNHSSTVCPPSYSAPTILVLLNDKGKKEEGLR